MTDYASNEIIYIFFPIWKTLEEKFRTEYDKK